MAAATGSSPRSYVSQIPYLSPQQQNLLLAALSSQKKQVPNDKSGSFDSPTTNSSNIYGLTQLHGQPSGQQRSSEIPRGVDPSMLSSSSRRSDLETPRRFASNSGGGTFGDNLWAEFDANGGFNFDAVKDEVIGDSQNFSWTGNSSSPEQDGREKRKIHDSDDSDEEDDEDQPASKTTTGKVYKKPGRKPLTSEPTTKRKAQNRAAQRAFRERKEKHLRDLEQKVDDLEQLSVSANQENGLLKAKIARMQKELEDYRKRLSVVSSVLNGSPSDFSSFATQRQGTDFNFEFPRFGSPPEMSNYEHSSASPTTKHQVGSGSTYNTRNGSLGRSSRSPLSHAAASPSSPQSTSNSRRDPADWSQSKATPDADFENGNSPDLWRSMSGMSGINVNGSTSQQISPFAFSGYAASRVGSPPHLMMPHNGSSSSCDTSPEPSHHLQSATGDVSAAQPNGVGDIAGSKIDSSSGSSKYNHNNNSENGVPTNPMTSQISEADIDFSNFDWLGQQNAQFDPLLFGDYRESQDAVIGTADFASGLYDDTFDSFNAFTDFGVVQMGKAKPATPSISNALLNNANGTSAAPTNKISLIEQVERQKDGTYEEPAAASVSSSPLPLPSNESNNVASPLASSSSSGLQARKHCPEMMSAKTIFTHLKDNPAFQSGQFDIDSLCSELSMKATCSETGMSIPTKTVEKVLWKLATGKADGAPK